MKQHETRFGWPRGCSIFLDSDGPPDHDLWSIREQGFTDVEIRPSWSTLDWNNQDELARWAQRLDLAGLRVHSLHASFDRGSLTAADSKVRARSLSRHKRAVDALRDLGGSLYVVDLAPDGNMPHPIAGSWPKRAVRSLARLSQKCKERGLSLVVRLGRSETEDPREVDWIMERLPASEVGLSVDLESEVWRRILLERTDGQPLRLRRIESDEGSTDTLRWMRSNRRRVERALQSAAPRGLWVVKPQHREAPARLPVRPWAERA